MDQQGHGQLPAAGMVGSGASMPYNTNVPYQPNQLTGGPNPGSLMTSVGAATSQPTPGQLAQHNLVYQQIHHQQQQQLQQVLQSFCANQYQDIEKVTDFKNHSLPLARIKKIMKVDEDVMMISAEAPVVFARACEMFILELTLRSWNHTEENKRRMLQKNDIAAAITRTDIFDFLVDIVPREDPKDEVLLSFPRGVPVAGAADALSYWNVPPQQFPLCMLSSRTLIWHNRCGSHHPIIKRFVRYESLNISIIYRVVTIEKEQLGIFSTRQKTVHVNYVLAVQ